MKSWFRNPPARKWLFVAPLWIAGLLVIYWATPAGPRDGWKIPVGHSVLGFLQDGRTLLCLDDPQRRKEPVPTPEHLLSLWDFETGTKIKTLPIEIDPLHRERVSLNSHLDLIFYQEALFKEQNEIPEIWTTRSGPGNVRRLFRLSVFDAGSGRAVSQFEYTHWNNPWSCPSEDGKKVALIHVSEEGSTHLRIYDLVTGKLISEIPTTGTYTIALFSKDSTLIAWKNGDFLTNDKQQSKVRVHDTVTGNLISELGSIATDYKKHLPSQFFSPDGTLIADRGAVFETASGKKMYDLPSIFVQPSPDGHLLHGWKVIGDGQSAWLPAFDARTGLENEAVRCYLPSRDWVGSRAFFCDIKHQLMIVYKSNESEPSRFRQWLRKIPGMDWLFQEKWPRLFIHYPTQTILGETYADPILIAPDGKSFLTCADPYSPTFRWDIPPKRPWISLLLGWTAWSLFFWLIQNRVFMQPRPPSGREEGISVLSRD